MMTLYLILAAVGLLLVVGFVWQFSPRAALYALPVVGAVLGVSVFQRYRRRKLLAQFAEREKELEEMEARLSVLQNEHAHSERDVVEARASLEEERRAFLIQLADIETRSREAVAAEVERIHQLSPSAVLDEVSSYLAELERGAPSPVPAPAPRP